MKLYQHTTDGGAEYYSTTYTETPSGHKEGALEGVCLRTDGGELEICNFALLKKAGFKSVVLPDGTRVKL